MPANPTPADQAPSDASQLTKVQKLAVLLVILGPETAAQILRSLDEPELELVSTEMAKITLVSQELKAEILQEFSELAVQAGTAERGGVAYTQSVLEKAVGLFKA